MGYTVGVASLLPTNQSPFHSFLQTLSIDRLPTYLYAGKVVLTALALLLEKPVVGDW
jgi:hypothetical protein